MEKQSSWFGLIQDTELGLTLTTTVSGTSSDDVKSASFAKVVKEQVFQYSVGQIYLAQEQNLLSKFKLTNGSNTFSVVDLEVGIVRTKGKSVGAQILLAAVDATKSIALPADPFTTAYGVATTYVNSVFSPLLNQAEQQKEAVSHHITMNISSSDTCTGDDERTGTKAIIDAVDDPTQPGYIDITKIDSYCFKSVLTPAFVLKFAALPSGGTCDKVTQFVDLQNSYLAFYVNSDPMVPIGIARKPDAAQVGSLKLTPPKQASFASEQSKLHLAAFNDLVSKGVDERGAVKDTASLFSAALLSNAKTEDIAKTFNVKARTVEGYRDSLKRCIANGVSANQCF
jgi:hypothetical protein